MTSQTNAPKTKWDVIQEAMNDYDPKEKLAEREKEKPSLDGKIREAPHPVVNEL